MNRKYLLYSGINTAKLTRLVAKLIDGFIVVLLTLLFYPFGLVLGVFYIAIADGLNDGQSVGKKIMGFAVLSLEDGMPCSLKQSVIRNLPISVPLIFAIIPLWGWILAAIFSSVFIIFELYLLFKLDSGHRLGDVMADTTVIANDGNRADLRKRQSGWFDQKSAMTM